MVSLLAPGEGSAVRPDIVCDNRVWDVKESGKGDTRIRPGTPGELKN